MQQSEQSSSHSEICSDMLRFIYQRNQIERRPRRRDGASGLTNKEKLNNDKKLFFWGMETASFACDGEIDTSQNNVWSLMLKISFNFGGILHDDGQIWQWWVQLKCEMSDSKMYKEQIKEL